MWHHGGMDTTALEAARDSLAAARQAEADAVRDLHEAVAEAARTGTPQTTICAATGLTREQVRRITRAAGIPPRR